MENSDVITTKFSRFPDLPKELRLKIVEIAAHQPRLLEIKQKEVRTPSGSPSSSNPEMGNHTFKSFCHAPVPAILQANRESRKEALKFYQPRFGLASGLESRIYVNNVSDIIFLRGETFVHLVEYPDLLQKFKKEIKDIQSLGLALRSGVHAWEKTDSELNRLLSWFPSLRSIIFIDGGYWVWKKCSFDQLIRIENHDVLHRYQEKHLVKAVQKRYGPDKKYPTVELLNCKNL